MKPSHILARKAARTKLYAMLYGTCTKGVQHENKPWLDSNRRGANLPSKAEFTTLSKAATFSPRQFDRAKARFIELGGQL